MALFFISGKIIDVTRGGTTTDLIEDKKIEPFGIPAKHPELNE